MKWRQTILKIGVSVSSLILNKIVTPPFLIVEFIILLIETK